MSSIVARRSALSSPWARILAALALVGLLTAGVGRLKFDNSTDAFFVKDDPTLLTYENFRRLFATDEYTLVSFDAPEQADARFVAGLRELEARLSKLEHVRRVRSIASVRSIEGKGDVLDVRSYLEGAGDAEVAARLERARSHPYHRHRFVSADGRSLGIVIETDIVPGSVDYKIVLRDRIRAAVGDSGIAGLRPTLVGAPVTDADVRDIVGRESATFGALVVLIVAAGFLFVFRSLIAVLVPVGIALLSVGAAFGLMGWLGMPATLLTPIVPSFLISVGVGSSIFLLTQYMLARARSTLDARRVVQDTVRHVRAPCFLASLTTSGALLAFSASDIAPVRDVGVILGLGLLVAVVLTFTLGSGLLELLPPRVSARQAQRLARRSTTLAALDRLALRHQNVVLAAAGLLTLAAAASLLGLKTDYYYLGTFKESTPIRQDYKRSDARLPASAAIEVVLDGGQPGAFTEPVALQRLERVQQQIAGYQTLPLSSYSLADVSKEIRQALHENKPAEYRLPATRQEASQGLLLFESSGNDELKYLVTPDYRIARLTVQMATVPESQSAPVLALVQQSLDREFGAGSGVRAQVTGLVPMWARINSYLRTTQIQSLLLAFGITTLVLVVYARSLRVGLLLAFVNASVVLIVLGGMAAAGIPLDPYTVLVADIAIGVLDDDTIHFFSAIRSRLREGRSFDEAVFMARDSAGQAMTYLALCLMAGFGVYVLSSVASLVTFGVLAVSIIGLGLLWEWVVMPAYLAVLHRHGLFR